MIQESEKMTKHVFSFILCLLLIFCLSSSLVSASDNHGENDLNASTFINGYSKFVIEDDININSEFSEGFFWLGLAHFQINLRNEGCLILKKANELGHPYAKDALNINC